MLETRTLRAMGVDWQLQACSYAKTCSKILAHAKKPGQASAAGS